MEISADKKFDTMPLKVKTKATPENRDITLDDIDVRTLLSYYFNMRSSLQRF